MYRVEMNKGWKIFGICMFLLLLAIGIFLIYVAVTGHINDIGFVQQFLTIFHISKPPVEPPVETASILRMLI